MHGRVTKGQDKAINSHGDKYIVPSQTEWKLDLIFARKAKIILDIGFGAGETLIALAQNNPEKNILGIEVHKPGIGALIYKANKLNITNIKIIQEDAEVILNGLKVKNQFEAIILFFPDPWPKRKHNKRRLIKEDFINLLERVIEKEGFFVCKTDWENYKLDILTLFNKNKSWKRCFLSDIPKNINYLPETNFDRKARLSGRKSSFIIFQKI